MGEATPSRRSLGMKATLSTGETLGFPVASRKLNQFLVCYLARSADVRRLLPADLRPVDYGYGLTHVNLYWLEAAASDADFSMIRFQVKWSLPECNSTHSASKPSRPARPASCW